MSMPEIKCANIDKCCAAASLAQSIALEEAAISHILNAEGEKIQKSLTLELCSMKDLKDLLDVNRSVADMVEKITALEAILESKLDMIVPLLDDCHKRPPKMEGEE